ncbi:hypothetical protein [Paenibacillus thiaminolyticus]|uniref:hypothetical protein n=1 Tax=Paenibacillus thiaminolyticus TaxID=49283 RepID=UPI002543A4D9|nr:hypothetical protein [Paenibacillus thiaminolyticus]WII36649.1 hypothetical protein O0V01_23865 [Paenibacillus thiaminolyticus]
MKKMRKLVEFSSKLSKGIKGKSWYSCTKSSLQMQAPNVYLIAKGATIMSFFLKEGDYLIYKIESVRQQMMQIAAEKKNFTDKSGCRVKPRVGYLPCGVSEKKERR